MDENLLPFEKVKRAIWTKKDAETNKLFGKCPEERSGEELINYGVININKPSGPTSHQISDYVRRVFGITKAGHSGTLER